MLLGRTNVGKTTLVNKLCGGHRGLEHEEPHTTRDPVEAILRSRGQELSLWDTPGPEDDWNPEEGGSWAIPRAFMLVVDAQAGLQPLDQELGRLIRRSERPALCVINKFEGKLSSPSVEHSFGKLVSGPSYPVSALQTTGLEKLRNYLITEFSSFTVKKESTQISLCVCGKPNVGKSSLVNFIMGEDRIYISKKPGTTRDLIQGVWSWDGKDISLTDTPGIRRRTRIHNGLERQAVGWALGAFRGMDVVFLVVDASLGLSKQERDLFELARRSAEVVVVATKMDLVKRTQSPTEAEGQISKFLGVPEGVHVVETSAVTGEGIPGLMSMAHEVHGMACGRTLAKKNWSSDELPALGRLGHEFHALHLEGVRPLGFRLAGLVTVDLSEDRQRGIRRAIASDLDLKGVKICLVDEKRG